LLQEHWLALPERFPTVRLDEFVIMPDHLHFILWLEGQQSTNPRLSEVIGAYKSLVAVAWIKHVENNELNCSARVWQKGYYERVVRQDELDQTRYYIRTNPLKLMPSSYLESEQ
jgi:REP element-mobilizing transposase RayT